MLWKTALDKFAWLVLGRPIVCRATGPKRQAKNGFVRLTNKFDPMQAAFSLRCILSLLSEWRKDKTRDESTWRIM